MNEFGRFIDRGVVNEVVEAIRDEHARIHKGSGRFIYPLPVSGSERKLIYRKIGRQSRSLQSRISIFSGIRLEEGIGSVIEIREKEERRR